MKFVIILVKESAGARTLRYEDVQKFLSVQASLPQWGEAYAQFMKFDWYPGNAMQLPNGWLFSVQEHVEITT